MHHAIAAATMLWWASGPVLAVGAVEQELMDLTQEACAAFIAHDVATLERILAPGFTLVGSNADVQSLQQVLAEVRARDPEYSEFRNHSMQAQVWDDAAIVQGITSLAGTSGGQSFVLDVRFTDTLIRSERGWQLVVSHVTRIPPTAPVPD